MYIPFITRRSDSTEPSSSSSTLQKRKGGGGHGGGGGRGGGGRSSGSGRGSRGSPPSYTRGAPPPPYSVSGGSAVRGSTVSAGGGSAYAISRGSFAGRSAGGGTRAGVYGSAGAYGSGYPGGSTNRAYVGGTGFPYMFWPVSYGHYPYYYGSGAYGRPDNSSRPGGPLISYTLIPTWTPNGPIANGTAAPTGNAFALYGDSNSVVDMVNALEASSCGVTLDTVGAVFPADGNVEPQNVVQYYRASSFALVLDGYNSTLPVVNDETGASNQTLDAVVLAPVASIPGINMTYFDCLNTTVGDRLGLLNADDVNSAGGREMMATGLWTLPALLVGWVLMGV